MFKKPFVFYIFRPMEFQNVLWLLAAFIAVINLSFVFASVEEIQRLKATSVHSVDIKPGAGRQEVTDKLGKFHCKFQYKAQGGTNEEWSLSISVNKATKEWLCTVERPSGRSYLFFEEFKLEVTGANLQEAFLEKEPGVMLSEVEYMINRKENSVQHSPGRFNSQLSKVQIYATKPVKGKREL